MSNSISNLLGAILLKDYLQNMVTKGKLSANLMEKTVLNIEKLLDVENRPI